MMRRTAAILGVLMLAAVVQVSAQDTPPAPAKPRDTVTTTDGEILANIEIIAETPSELKIDTTGDGKPDRTVDQDKVRTIMYDGSQTPADYLQAVALYRVSDYDQAITKLRDASKGRTRKWVKDYSAYYGAMCLAAKAEADPAGRPAAIAALEGVLKDDLNRWRDDARYELGRVHLSAGDVAKAKTEFETLASSAHREQMRLTAAVGLGDILMAEKKASEALTRFEDVVTKARDKSPDLYVRATVGKAEALTALERFSDAANFLNGMLPDAKDNKSLLATVRVALGDCYYAWAGTIADGDEQAAKYKAALTNYLWIVVVFTTEKAELAKSLYYAGECWKKLGEPDRARQLQNELKSKFGRTKWAGMIR